MPTLSSKMIEVMVLLTLTPTLDIQEPEPTACTGIGVRSLPWPTRRGCRKSIEFTCVWKAFNIQDLEFARSTSSSPPIRSFVEKVHDIVGLYNSTHPYERDEVPLRGSTRRAMVPGVLS